MDGYDEVRQAIHKNIDYMSLLVDYPESAGIIDGMVEIIASVILSQKETILIGREDKPAAVVKSQFLKLRHSHILYALMVLEEQTTQICNIWAYLRTVLYRAPFTVDLYYHNRAVHDMYRGRDSPA